MDSGVTVIGAEAPSAYEMAPRTENAGHVVGSMAMVASPASTGLSGSMEKKKRGRPRKYGPDGTIAGALSPVPLSASAPPSGDYSSSGKRGRGRGRGYLNKQMKKIMMESSGEWGSGSIGTNFTPHVITVNAGEDVTMKVISFSQQGPRAICILSATGVISNVTLRQHDSSGGTLTYEGRFEILSLSGSFMPTETQGTRSRSGGMSVSLASPDGRVVGGSVAGLLIAAGPVQVVVGSFLPGGSQHDQKPKVRSDTVPATMPPNSSTAAPALPAPVGEDGDYRTSQHSYNTSKTDFASHTSFGRENWPSMQETRSFGTDINISLPAG